MHPSLEAKVHPSLEAKVEHRMGTHPQLPHMATQELVDSGLGRVLLFPDTCHMV